MRERAKLLELIVLGVVLITGLTMVTYADPTGTAGASVLRSSRGTPPTGVNAVAAQAGNVSELLINSTAITRTWQGYFGNITSRIVLDDAKNMTMYDWNNIDPVGDIYASNASSVQWSKVFCFNLNPAQKNEGNITNYEAYLGVPSNAADGIDETFKVKKHSAFAIGTRSFGANSCYSAQTYVSDVPQTGGDFVEVALYDNVSGNAVWGTILNNSVTGFDGRKHDFQMMVPVQGGHAVPAALDTFYFYVELA